MAETSHEHPWYLAVFAWLFVLTVLEVGIAEWDFARTATVVTLSFLAFIKAALVALYFMHLKFERYKLITFVFAPVFCTVLLLVYLVVDALRLGHV